MENDAGSAIRKRELRFPGGLQSTGAPDKAGAAAGAIQVESSGDLSVR